MQNSLSSAELHKSFHFFTPLVETVSKLRGLSRVSTYFHHDLNESCFVKSFQDISQLDAT
jgi:hypothetical protein